jgi:hypothetical protein
VAEITGWGRGTWGQGAWGTPNPIDVTTVVGTTGLGSVTVTGDASVSVTGVVGTGAIGDVVVSLPRSVSVTGVVGTGEINSVNVWGEIIPDQTPSWSDINA